MKRSAHQIVRAKRAWEAPREPGESTHEEGIGAKGWYTRGYLPHYDKPGTIQMITFRLADAMPASLRHEWEPLFELKDERERRTKLEAYLDQGRGDCVLRDACAAAVEDVLLRFDGQRYRIAAWMVMPNHAHALVELWEMPLGKLLKAWKGSSANAVNQISGRTGKLWQTEYWDRYMRDETHFRKALHYIEWNPVKAGLATTPESWAFGSANLKWRWSAADRYQGAHLLNGPVADKNVGAPWKDGDVQQSERGHSCPPVGGARRDKHADKNVGAPGRRIS